MSYAFIVYNIIAVWIITTSSQVIGTGPTPVDDCQRPRVTCFNILMTMTRKCVEEIHGRYTYTQHNIRPSERHKYTATAAI